jgi:uncharacterized lipoprotein YmbA
MNRNTGKMLLLMAGVILVAPLSGCGTTQPSTFYILTPTTQARQSVGNPAAEQGPIIALGPIDIPDYLNRPQIINYVNENTLNVDEFHRWAEPLENNISRVLAINLSAMIPTDRIVIFPWKQLRTQIEFDYRISAQVARFESTTDNTVALTVRWVVTSGDYKNILAVKKSQIVEAVQGQEYSAIITAHSRALEKLSVEIAQVIHDLQSH